MDFSAQTTLDQRKRLVTLYDIQLKGEAQFSPVRDTQLFYVTNTIGEVFMSVSLQHYYGLLSGRWFSAAKLEGPWEFVAGSALPPSRPSSAGRPACGGRPHR